MGNIENCNNIFLVYSPTAVIKEDLPRKGYAGISGRLDVIVRGISASIINKDTCFIGFLGGHHIDSGMQAIIVFDVLKLESFSEKSVFLLIYRCFKDKHSCRGMIIDEIELPFLINKLRNIGYNFFLLDEKGEDYCKHVRKIVSGRNIFVMGAHENIPPKTFEFFKKYSTEISIGPVSLHTSHVITYLSTIIQRLSRQITPCPML